MQSTAVVYQSKYGHAKTYATWLAEALGADLLEAPKAKKLERYDLLIFGGGLYAGGISGAKLLRENFGCFAAKKLIVFTVGLSSTGDPAIFQKAIDRAFAPEMQQQIRFFHLRGGIDYKKLGPVHKTMMSGLRYALKRKKNPTPEDIMILETYGGRVDFRDKASIQPIVQYVQSLLKEDETK